jgi:hypothetical protein
VAGGRTDRAPGRGVGPRGRRAAGADAHADRHPRPTAAATPKPCADTVVSGKLGIKSALCLDETASGYVTRWPLNVNGIFVGPPR